MTREILEGLKKIKQKIQDIIAHKKLQAVLMNPEEIERINDYINNTKKDLTDQVLEEKELGELKAIYKGLCEIFTNISIDWDKNKNSLSSEKSNIHYQNLGSILKIVTLIKELDKNCLIKLSVLMKLYHLVI